MDVFCLCFVGPQGNFMAHKIGCSKVEKRTRGGYVLATRPPPGAAVRFSGLPRGYQVKWSNVEEGMAIEVFDDRGRPVDHGFALVIERPESQEIRTRRLSHQEIDEVKRIAAKKEDETKGTKGTSGTDKDKKEKG